MADINLNNYPKRLTVAIRKMNDEPKICPVNKKGTVSFSKIRLTKGSSHGRVGKVEYCMGYWAKWNGKSFREVPKDDLIIAVGELENTKFTE